MCTFFIKYTPGYLHYQKTANQFNLFPLPGISISSSEISLMQDKVENQHNGQDKRPHILIMCPWESNRAANLVFGIVPADWTKCTFPCPVCLLFRLKCNCVLELIAYIFENKFTWIYGHVDDRRWIDNNLVRWSSSSNICKLTSVVYNSRFF